MREFLFDGEIPGSKSELIRAHIARSLGPGISVRGSSRADDVVAAVAAADAILAGAPRLDADSSGLLFRLLLARASRLGRPVLVTGKPRLLERPHGPLLEVLRQLGVRATAGQGGVEVEGPPDGAWIVPDGPVRIDVEQSSQYLSAVLLAAWDLPRPLTLELSGPPVSQGYLEITTELLGQLGMKVREAPGRLEIPAQQRPRASVIAVDPDLSTSFAVAALAAVAGRARLERTPERSRQPDLLGFSLLERMGAVVRREGTALLVERAGPLRPIEVDLAGAPDLFPVLSVLAAVADGRSVLRGAPHLALKESNRITKAAELIARLGRRTEPTDGGLVIHGRAVAPGEDLPPSTGAFDPDHDHRQVMAAYVARFAGLPVELTDPRAVTKSAPEFLEWVRG